MQPKSVAARLTVYALLIGFSALFLFPLAWLFVTSLKPVEQAMAMPPSILPRSYVAAVEGRSMEVTRDFAIEQRSAIVLLAEGPLAGRRVLLPMSDIDPDAGRAK